MRLWDGANRPFTRAVTDPARLIRGSDEPVFFIGLSRGKTAAGELIRQQQKKTG
jgi:hypothetical protein